MLLLAAFLGCLLAFALTVVGVYTYVVHVAIPKLRASPELQRILATSYHRQADPTAPPSSRSEIKAMHEYVNTVAADNEHLRADNERLRKIAESAIAPAPLVPGPRAARATVLLMTLKDSIQTEQVDAISKAFTSDQLMAFFEVMQIIEAEDEPRPARTGT